MSYAIPTRTDYTHEDRVEVSIDFSDRKTACYEVKLSRGWQARVRQWVREQVIARASDASVTRVYIATCKGTKETATKVLSPADVYESHALSGHVERVDYDGSVHYSIA